jgi:hypothetical protein
MGALSMEAGRETLRKLPEMMRNDAIMLRINLGCNSYRVHYLRAVRRWGKYGRNSPIPCTNSRSQSGRSGKQEPCVSWCFPYAALETSDGFAATFPSWILRLGSVSIHCVSRAISSESTPELLVAFAMIAAPSMPATSDVA